MSTTTAPATTAPAVWVGCLACYNAGRLTGEWVAGTEAADLTPERLHPRRLLASAPYPHEELWVMDFEGYRGLLDGETSPAHAQELAELIDTIEADGRVPVEAFAAYAANNNTRPAEVDLDEVANHYRGEYRDAHEWAEEWLDRSGMLDELPEWAKPYEDALVREWLASAENGGEFWTEDAPDGGVYLFTY